MRTSNDEKACTYVCNVCIMYSAYCVSMVLSYSFLVAMLLYVCIEKQFFELM